MSHLSSRPLLATEVAAAVDVMAEAYVDDPLCRFILPLRLTRKRTLAKFFRAYFSASTDRVVVVGNPICGVALWNPPGGGALSLSFGKLRVFLPLLATLYPIGLARARPVLRAQAELRSRWAPASHYYLDNVAVLPTLRGQGLASTLIRPVLMEADLEGVATYTDTFTLSNVPIYEHFGFRCVGHVAESRTGLSVWGLLRPPGMQNTSGHGPAAVVPVKAVPDPATSRLR